MMRSSITVFLAMGILQCSLAQTFNWAGQMDATRARSVHVDANGSVYTTGRFTGTVDFDPGSGVTNLAAVGASEGIYVQKLDASGNLVWAKHMAGSINGEGFSVATDNLLNVYVIGYFRGTVDFDPGAGTMNLTTTTPPFYDLFIQKLDSDGNLVWVKRLVDVYDGTPDSSIAVDRDGNVYCTGFFEGILDFDPGNDSYPVSSGGTYVGYVLKLDTSGNFNWVRTFNTTSAGISVEATGDDVLVTGYFLGSLAPDQSTPATIYVSKGMTDTFVLKYTLAGSFAWGRQIGGPGNEYGRSITVDDSGNIFLTGEFTQTAEFNVGGTSATLTSAGQSDIFIQKFDPSGNMIWVKQIGGTGFDGPRNISISSTGYLYVAGQFSGTTSFNIGATPKTFNTPGSTLFMLAVGPTMEVEWLVQYPLSKLSMTAMGDHVYATGEFFNTFDFDPGEGSYPMTSAPPISSFVVKLSTEVITSIEDIGAGFSVYPNPVSSVAFLSIEKEDANEVRIRLIDIHSRIVKNQVVEKGAGSQIDMTGLSAGLYILELRDSRNNITMMRLLKN